MIIKSTITIVAITIIATSKKNILYHCVYTYIYIHTYIYIPEKGGTKASPQSNAHGFFCLCAEVSRSKGGCQLLAFHDTFVQISSSSAVLGQILARSLLEPDPEQKPVGSNFLPFGGHSAGYCISLLGRTGNGYIYNFRTNSKQTEAMTQHCEAKNTQTLLHTDPCRLHTNVFTHKRFYTQTLFYFDTQMLLHTDPFTIALHRNTLTQRRFYRQTASHRHACTHRRFHTQTRVRRDSFTHRRFYTQTL